jgi:hypothetical protein
MGVGGQHHVLATVPLGKTHCMGGWVGPTASLYGCGKFHPHQDLISGSSSL